jgi:heme/copper-type cytochrome/quinol oxidase subunit 4
MQNYFLKHKKSVVIVLKMILITLIIMLMSVTFKAPYINLLNWFFTTIIIYLILTLLYFSYLADEKERTTILTMWKLYFSIIAIMTAIFYNIEDNINKQKIDYQKTKLSYQLKQGSNEVNSTFETYTSLISAYINNISAEDRTNKQKNDKRIITYANFTVNILNIITLFMFVWALSEFKIFKEKK